jgi:hypothetical protein
MERLDDLFHVLEVEGASPEQLLECDLGLDFRERVCLREDIEDDPRVVITDDDLKQDMTVLELAGLFSRKLRVEPGIDGFDGGLMEHITISATPESVQDALLDVNAWPALFPFVRNAKVTYYDGMYQEFTMELHGRRGDAMPVRSVRHCQAGQIAYFQPEPPSFLKINCGDWYIRPLSQDTTLLVVVQRWTLSDRVEKLVPGHDDTTACQQIVTMNARRARATLNILKRSLEHNSSGKSIALAA